LLPVLFVVTVATQLAGEVFQHSLLKS